jgi:hypothetical protein
VARLAGHGRNRASELRVVVDPRRLSRLEDRRGEARAVERPAAADREAGVVQGREHRDRAIRLIAKQPSGGNVEYRNNLLHDRREQLRGGRALGDERCDASKRGLLLGKQTTSVSLDGAPVGRLGTHQGNRFESRVVVSYTMVSSSRRDSGA